MAGTVVLTSQRHEGSVRYSVITATADASDGSFPATTLKSLGIFVDGALYVLQTNPGATAPTASYDITLLDVDGLDRLDGVGVNRDSASSERAVITGSPVVAPSEELTLTITGNSVNSAVIVITLFHGAANGVGGSAGGAGVDISPYVDGLEGLLTPSVTATITTAADAATSATLLSSDVTRKGFIIANDSTQGLYLKYGTTASSTDWTVYVPAGATWEERNYSGRVDGIWVADASGNARITSLD